MQANILYMYTHEELHTNSTYPSCLNTTSSLFHIAKNFA